MEENKNTNQARQKPAAGAQGADDKFNRKKGGPRKKKVCAFCQEKTPIDYKDTARLRKYITEKGKIVPRRMSGTCAMHQRELAVEIKKARNIALLPFKAD